MRTFYVLLAAAGLSLAAPLAQAATRSTDEPTETRKANARERAAMGARAAKASKSTKTKAHRRLNSGLNHTVLVLLGLEARKSVTSPAKLDRQLHARQKHLRAKARLDAKARRRRTNLM